MNVIVTDNGFGPDDWAGGFAPLAGAGSETRGLDLDPGDDPAGKVRNMRTLRIIRIHFASFADGRGFTLARRLRQQGYRGRLRASGHVLADQYAMARRAGFDEVEIDQTLAARQPEDQWRARADWRANDYQSRLRGRG